MYCISLPSICPVASVGSSSEAEQNAALYATQNCQGPRARAGDETALMPSIGLFTGEGNGQDLSHVRADPGHRYLKP